MLSLVLAVKRRRDRRASVERALEERDRSFAVNAAAARQEQLLAEYGRGFVAGVDETLDLLMGRTSCAPDVAYVGERPGELSEWVRHMRYRFASDARKP